jgi:hypothetical protein
MASSSTRRQPPLRPSSTTNRTGVNKRVNTPVVSNDDEYGIANGKQVPRSYLLKLIKGSRMNGILNLASRGLTEGKLVINMYDKEFLIFSTRRNFS